MPRGWESYHKNILKVYGLRVCNAFIILLLFLSIRIQFEEQLFNFSAFLCETLVLIIILMIFYIGENIYKNQCVSSKAISVHSNGLIIPPTYLRALSREKGFIHKDLIDHLEVRWHNEHTVYFSKVSSINWYDAPVEFVVHLKNGKAISSGKRPPETIRGAVETMENAWGINVTRQGFKNGRMERIVDLETVEERDL